MRSIPLVVTDTSKRTMDIDVHYRQTLNRRLGQVGSQTDGWFVGGSLSDFAQTLSIVDRIIFSNDTARALRRGDLSSSRNQSGATGNINNGWIGGGNIFSVGIISSVDRIIFAQDGNVALIRAPLSTARRRLVSQGNQTDGWFVGGDLTSGGASGTTGGISVIDRIMFSNDTTTASIRNPLPENRTGAASSGNTSAMWIGGGSGGTTIVSSVLRLTFANDTSVLSTRGPLSLARDGLSSISDPNNSWFIGGTFSNQVGFTRIDRVTFSNDTTTASVRGNLSRPLIAFSAEGNTTDGWFGGGYREPNAFGLIIYSEIERIIFSNDTTTTSIRGSLSSFRMSVTSP